MKEIYHDLDDYYINDNKVVNIHIYENGSNYNIRSYIPYMTLRWELNSTPIGSYAFSIISTVGGTACYTLTSSINVNTIGNYVYQIGIDYGTLNEVLISGNINIKAAI